jgi:hypothetical protein
VPKNKDVAEGPAMQMAAEDHGSPIAAPELTETLRVLGERCSAMPDLDYREADEILGYDDIGVFR